MCEGGAACQVHNTGGMKAVVYSAHDSTLLAMQSRMGIKASATPAFAAHYTFELHEVGTAAHNTAKVARLVRQRVP